ncbi:MAG TPA: hypothetical protein ENJ50_07160, partial [Planctomycetaceae bacterium]|nr:hypothetical protein [Planctomycetaceae bacterium]
MRRQRFCISNTGWRCRLALAVAVLLAATGCNDRLRSTDGPVSGIRLASQDRASFELFRKTVVPVLENRCGLDCHGISPAEFARIQGQPDESGYFFFPIDPATGRIPRDEETLLEAFRAVRGDQGSDHEADGPQRIEYGEPARFSNLLRAPRAADLGGTPHRGLDVFTREDDPDYLALHRWVELELASHPVEQSPLTKEEQFFAREILPVMARNSCFVVSCHGPSVFNDLKLEPPLPSPDGQLVVSRDFSLKAIRANRKKMLGSKSRFANLGGDLRLSRLLVKNLPIAKGGIHQRGGNIQFFEDYDDADVKKILQWLELERAALASRLRSRGAPVPDSDLGRVQGLAFIRGPLHQPRRFFDFSSFFAGSDIFIVPVPAGKPIEAAGEAPRNLTARFHPDGPVE